MKRNYIVENDVQCYILEFFIEEGIFLDLIIILNIMNVGASLQFLSCVGIDRLPVFISCAWVYKTHTWNQNMF